MARSLLPAPLCACALLLAALGASAEESAPAAPQSQPASPDAAAVELRRRVEELTARADGSQRLLEQQSTELARLRQALGDEAAARTRMEADVHAQLRRAATFKLGGLSVSLFGFVQADGVLYDQASQDELDPSTGEPLNASRFSIRRGRLHVEADYGIASGLLELDGNTVNGPAARVAAGEVALQWPSRTAGAPPYLRGAIGLQRIPFGFEVQQKDYVRLFLERSNVIRALFPGEFDLGLAVSGGWRFLRYAVAVMNGNPAGDQQFTLRDPSASKDLVGRLGVATRLQRRVGLQAGLSAVCGTGFSPGRAATKNTVVWNDVNGDGQIDPTELIGVPGQAALASSTFDRWAFGGDLRVLVAVPRLGELTLMGELVWAANLDRALQPADPVGAGHDLRELGWTVGFTQAIGRRALVGVRYDRYNPDADARDRQGPLLVPLDPTYATLAVAMAAAWPPYVRFTLEYDRNTNALGRTASGAPETLGADVVTLRGQVVF